MNNLYSLTVVIPFYNEIYTLSHSLNRVLQIDIFEKIILVDNCSNDGSTNIALEFAKKWDKIIYFKTNSNHGKGGAINDCKHLIKTSHIVIHDADLEYFPEDIIEMKNLSQENPDSLILGSRFIGNKERKNVYLRTLIANKVMSLFFSLINFYLITDVATCYKLFPTTFYKNVKLKEKGFSIEIELLSKFLKYNKEVLEVPIKYHGRTYKEGKKIKTVDGFKYLINTLRYRFFN